MRKGVKTLVQHVAISVLPLALAVVVAGCGGNSNTIRSTDEALEYLSAIMRGGELEAKLAPDASLAAKAVFYRADDVAAIRRYYDEQTKDAPKWVCEQIGRLSKLGEFGKVALGPPPKVEDAVQEVQASYGDSVPEGTVRDLAEHLQGITSSDAVKLADEICTSGI